MQAAHTDMPIIDKVLYENAARVYRIELPGS